MDGKVGTVSRLARWSLKCSGITESSSFSLYYGLSHYSRHSHSVVKLKSDAFQIGIWNWQLGFEMQEIPVVRLFVHPSQLSERQLPWARFTIRVTDSHESKHDSEVQEKIFREGEEHTFTVKCHIDGRLMIDVEFLELKICQPDATDAISMLPLGAPVQSLVAQNTHARFYRMLHDSIYRDVTINTKTGTIKAHKAVLDSSSPFFSNIFLEKQASTIDIQDMSHETCLTFLNYIYGEVKHEEFLKHRKALLAAAKQYQMPDLKDVCEESLLEDINTQNVLERLQESFIYKLDRLKNSCYEYLFQFGKVCDIKEEFNSFLEAADQDLAVDVEFACTMVSNSVF